VQFRLMNHYAGAYRANCKIQGEEIYNKSLKDAVNRYKFDNLSARYGRSDWQMSDCSARSI
jgi:hypothetical protein